MSRIHNFWHDSEALEDKLDSVPSLSIVSSSDSIVISSFDALIDEQGLLILPSIYTRNMGQSSFKRSSTRTEHSEGA
jgi:hypothetical protein